LPTESEVSNEDIDLKSWIGRSQTLHDTFVATPVAALTATLDHPPSTLDKGTALPPLWHWLYFLPLHRQSEIGADGHAKRGDRVARRSTIEDVTLKDGRSGKLVFVKVRHELHCNDSPRAALVEFHDIVYRDAKRPGDVEPPPQAALTGAPWQREIVPDDVLLFRYSALTFNGHRIHYDRKYVTEVEGYPGLVVHGPLIATLLMDLLRRQMPAADVASFRFRALRPTFDGHAMRVNGQPQPDGKTIKLWAQDHEGWLTMDAVATLR
jgi:3-methylfumaryl-CoA hydratase